MTRSPLVLVAVAVAACASAPRPENGTPGAAATAATKAVARDTAAAAPPAPHAHPANAAPSADVQFIRGMLAHHAQALVMTALVPSRTSRRDIGLLAERIDVSQRDEIALMRQWLRRRGEPDSVSAHAGHDSATHAGMPAMPGMLTAKELETLRAARGAEFDRLFLEDMIRHHEGALAMVATLLASRGGTSNTEIYRLAADIDADQRAEIQRMRALLGR